MVINNESRMTKQRHIIFHFLKNVRTHPTAEKVYNEVVKQMPNITLATVYRNLNLLANQGKIQRLEINKEYHYDADISKHQHCVCKGCGKIMDNFQENISMYALDQIKDFKAESVNVTYYGHCSNC